MRSGSVAAAERSLVEAVRALIAAGVAVDPVNNPGWSALLESIVLSNGGPAHQDTAHQLIAAGTDVNLAEQSGVRPLAHAEWRGYRSIAADLRAADGR